MSKPETTKEKFSFSRWQLITIASLTMGYAGYYFCRSNLSVATPLILSEFGDQGINKEVMGTISSFGVLFYAIGKFFNGIICDFIGGRKMFIFGMVASVLATIFFSFGTGAAVFIIAWSLNRLVQSMGWGSVVKVSSNWFPIQRHGLILGIISLSYLFGDVVARFFLGSLISYGIGWRGVFYAAAAVLGGLALWNKFFLKSSPKDVGEEEPPANPINLFGASGDSDRPESILTLLKPFLTSLSFWLVCVISFGLTLIRETFNFWTPTFLAEVILLSEGDAAQYSSLFPLFGGFSVLAAGFLTDYVAKGKRGNIMFVFLIPVIFALIALSQIEQGGSQIWALILISAVALFMIGPYGFLTNVISLDLGGKCGSATAAGIVDCIGYLGAIFSGWAIGSMVERTGSWKIAFLTLAGVAVVTAIATLAYWLVHEVFAKKKILEDASGEPIVDGDVTTQVENFPTKK